MDIAKKQEDMDWNGQAISESLVVCSDKQAQENEQLNDIQYLAILGALVTI